MKCNRPALKDFILRGGMKETSVFDSSKDFSL